MKVKGLEKAWLALSERMESSGMPVCSSEYISEWREYKAFKKQMRRFLTANGARHDSQRADRPDGRRPEGRRALAMKAHITLVEGADWERVAVAIAGVIKDINVARAAKYGIISGDISGTKEELAAILLMEEVEGVELDEKKHIREQDDD